jgi:hypothetical protein
MAPGHPLIRSLGALDCVFTRQLDENGFPFPAVLMFLVVGLRLHSGRVTSIPLPAMPVTTVPASCSQPVTLNLTPGLGTTD